MLANYRPLTTDTIVAIAKGEFTCQGVDTIVIKINALPIADACTDTMVCYGSPVTLGGKSTAIGNGPFAYSWSSGPTFTGNEANPVIQAENDGTYDLKITDINGCENKDSIKVQVNNPGKIHLTNQLSICKGQKITLGQSPLIQGSKYPYTYQWSPDSTLSANNIETPVAQPSTTTTYRLMVSNWNCPADTAYTSVTVHELPKAYVSPTLTMGNEGNVQLYAEGGVSYRWSPADNLNNSNIPDPIATPGTSTLYTVEVIDSFGCSSEAYVQVNVRNEVFIPEIFTPNGDGKNDVFKIYGFGIVELSLTIFDRNNNKVFESIDKDFITTQGWDGTYKGKALETGNYRWVIKGHFADGQAVLFHGKNTGLITLIR
jgi:gliding motility-associated-like protein